MTVPEIRIRRLNDAPVRAGGEYVLYWMIANRRPHWNYTLDRTVELCCELGRPLLVLEALRCDYQWASDRIHRFVLKGMADNRAAFARAGVRYYPYVEPAKQHGRELLGTLAQRAAAVVTDDFPCFFLPRMVAGAARKLSVRMEAVDSNGLVPLAATDRIFARAFDFRRWLQGNLLPMLAEHPRSRPAFRRLPEASSDLCAHISDRWPEASDSLLNGASDELRCLPIDHRVSAAAMAGGPVAARRALSDFLRDQLPKYATARNDPDDEAVSGLSPYLHFGHVSAHEVFDHIRRVEDWSPDDIGGESKGSREGWWGMSPHAEGFLDQLITWRELGYNMCAHNEDYACYESLPEWARLTLATHESDPREFVYGLEEFESAATHDSVWNAAQTQLVRDGRMHNYLRMLWGKKVLEWSDTPRDALATMIQLNNKYAVDGRNPNSYSGIFWVLGRYDRAWGPERPVFGKIRYMSSENTMRKLKLRNYLQRYSAEAD